MEQGTLPPQKKIRKVGLREFQRHMFKELRNTPVILTKGRKVTYVVVKVPANMPNIEDSSLYIVENEGKYRLGVPELEMEPGGLDAMVDDTTHVGTVGNEVPTRTTYPTLEHDCEYQTEIREMLRRKPQGAAFLTSNGDSQRYWKLKEMCEKSHFTKVLPEHPNYKFYEKFLLSCTPRSLWQKIKQIATTKIA